MSNISLLVLAGVLAFLGASLGVVHAQQGGDLQARILYAFESEDINQLASLIQTLDTQLKSGGDDAAKSYHLAHAHYRWGLLSAEAHPDAAAAAFDACVGDLKPLLRQDVKSAEALVLEFACRSSVGRVKHLGGGFGRGRAEDSLRAAAKLAPRNPRVVYFEAMDGLARAAPGSAEHERAFLELKTAAELFEGSSGTSVEVPGWGHAEAYLDLGRQLQARGDVVGARNWIEKALLSAPDYKAAQRQLSTLALH